MAGNRSGRPDHGRIAREAEQRAIDTDRSAADADQTLADADQTASDTAAERDATAAARDEAARRRDEIAAELESSIAVSDAPLAKKFELIRVRAASDRLRAAMDRERASSDRERAAADRERAARDGAEGASHRARLVADLQSAHLDALTGALRREIGWLTLGHEVERARRGDGRFVIAFVDVDGMKEVNDRHGHAEGDRVLQTLVWALRANLRPYDPIIRYGGDEFVCGMGGADLDDVARRFERIARAVQDDVGVRISVGLAQLARGETLDELTARADAALLEARSGRGQ